MISTKDMEMYRDLEDLQMHKTYLFYGITGKGNRFFSCGCKCKKDMNVYSDDEIRQKDVSDYKIKFDTYYDNEPKVTHFIELEYS